MFVNIFISWLVEREWPQTLNIFQQIKKIAKNIPTQIELLRKRGLKINGVNPTDFESPKDRDRDVVMLYNGSCQIHPQYSWHSS